MERGGERGGGVGGGGGRQARAMGFAFDVWAGREVNTSLAMGLLGIMGSP